MYVCCVITGQGHVGGHGASPDVPLVQWLGDCHDMHSVAHAMM